MILRKATKSFLLPFFISKIKFQLIRKKFYVLGSRLNSSSNLLDRIFIDGPNGFDDHEGVRCWPKSFIKVNFNINYLPQLHWYKTYKENTSIYEWIHQKTYQKLQRCSWHWKDTIFPWQSWDFGKKWRLEQRMMRLS